MFHLRSIRRKLCVGLLIVFSMLVLLTYGGIDGLVSYGRVVKHLDYSINSAPRRAELLAAIDLLFDPLLLVAPENSPAKMREFAKFQQHYFEKSLGETEELFEDFKVRLEEMPPTEFVRGTRTIVHDFIAQAESHDLRQVRKAQKSLADPAKNEQVRQAILRKVATLHTRAKAMPDPSLALAPQLDEARRVYQSRLMLVSISSGIGLILFGVMVYWGYCWIFVPIRIFHKGAKRVENGDFDYRISLKTNGEIAELVDVFNRVTAQFNDINRDLDRKVEEKTKELVLSERLASVGCLATGVAHEINNPLSAISMAAESLEYRAVMLLENCDADDAEVIPKYLQMIQNESVRCRGITERLLDFARGQDGERIHSNLNSIVSDVILMVENLSKFRDRTIIFNEQTPEYADVCPSEIKQVVLNLVTNALESMETGGKLEIEFQGQPNRVDMIFRDNGCGMTPDVIEQLFDPFFTRRRSGKGTGLGLSITHRIVEDHEGSIQAASEGAGKGSTFRVRLPRKSSHDKLSSAA